MKLARSVLPVLLCAGAAVPGAADTLTSFFPPDTRVVFGIRVHNLALSAVAQSFKTQAQAAGAGWLRIPLDGLDLLRDVDEVLLASNGKGRNPPAVIVVTGRFDVARWAQGAESYHEVPLLGSPRDGNSVIALLDATTVLIGTPDLVRAAIDQRGRKAGIDAALNDRITSLRQRYDVWGLGDRPDGFVSPVVEAKALDSVDRFQFGVQLVNGLELGAEVHTRSAEDAKKLDEAFGMLEGLFKSQAGPKSGARFDLEANGGTLKLDVSIPEDELKKAVQAMTAPHSTVGGPTEGPVTETAAPQAVAEAVRAVPAGAPAAAAAPVAAAPPADPPAAAEPAKTLPKAVGAQVMDKSGSTVILTLPGKK